MHFKRLYFTIFNMILYLVHFFKDCKHVMCQIKCVTHVSISVFAIWFTISIYGILCCRKGAVEFGFSNSQYVNIQVDNSEEISMFISNQVDISVH